MTLAEYEWMRNQLDEPIKLKKKRRMLDRVQEDSFDPYKEISNNRRHFKKTEDHSYSASVMFIRSKNDLNVTNDIFFTEFVSIPTREVLEQIPSANWDCVNFLLTRSFLINSPSYIILCMMVN